MRGVDRFTAEFVIVGHKPSGRGLLRGKCLRMAVERASSHSGCAAKLPGKQNKAAVTA
ncbi:MAG: hypothetical protein ABFD86_15170 [Bryobacteraceae bacterium]